MFWAHDYMCSMRTQRVLLGELVIDREPSIELYAELPLAQVRKQSAALKDKLIYLLDTRFRPAEPPKSISSLTIEDVAGVLHCRCSNVIRMMKQGKLHPFSDEDGELYFDPIEVEGIRHIPISPTLSRLVARN